MIRAGACVLDVTPPAGLRMAGFAAREAPALGAHDPLTVRALAVDDTALVVADVIALDEHACRRIRARAALPDAAIVAAATHTHGGPATLPGRLGGGEDPAFLQRLEDACVAALDEAARSRRPARLSFGIGPDPGIARNRRHPGGATDGAVRVLRVTGADGAPVATLACHACHPVVLGPDNRSWTADLAGAARPAIEAAHGAPCLMLTGCAGDANTGHHAHASLTLGADPHRSFTALAAYGARLAEAVLATQLASLPGETASARDTVVPLDVLIEPADRLASAWRAELPGAAPGRARLLRHWLAWADGPARQQAQPWPARVTCLSWGGLRVFALPGEVFAQTALDLYRRLDGPAIVAAYAEGCPGYIPPASEYTHGGYEVAEAHRFYGQPGPFAPGGAEKLLEAALQIA